MAQCNFCVTDFSISSGGRTDVRRHQESARHAKLAKSRRGLYEAFVEPLLFVEGWGGPVCRPWTNGLSRQCDKSGNDVRVLDRTSFIPGTTQLDTYWGATALLRDGVGVEVCPLVMMKVMEAFVRIQHFTTNTFSAEDVIQSNFYFLKFVGILLAAHVLISLAGFCVNFINICTGTSKMVGI